MTVRIIDAVIDVIQHKSLTVMPKIACSNSPHTLRIARIHESIATEMHMNENIYGTRNGCTVMEWIMRTSHHPHTIRTSFDNAHVCMTLIYAEKKK